jgi:hypothetical protein
MLNRNILTKAIPATLAAALLLCVAAETRAKEVVGIVTSVTGRWYADGALLSQGQKLAAGAVIKAKEPNAKYARVIVMLLDYTELSRVCDRKGLCGEPLVMPETVDAAARERPRGPQPPGFWERVVDAFVLSRRLRVRKTLARGSGFVGAVVKLDGRHVALDDALTARVRGYSRVVIERADVDAESSPSEELARVTLKPTRGRVMFDAPGLTPGLYNMTFKDPRGRGFPPEPLEILALATGTREYTEAARQFRMARALSEHWGRGEEIGANDFQMSFLQALAADGAR